ETANAQIKNAEQENVEKMPVREKARDDNAKAYEAMDKLAREFKPIVRNGEETTLLGQLADRFEELKKARGGTLLTIEALESDITLLIPRNLVSTSAESDTDSEAVTTEQNQS